MIRAFGIATDTVGVSPKLALVQFNNFPAGAWTGLEGGWLLVLAATMILIRGRRLLFLAAYLGAIAIILVVSMCVYDITRSMAYLLPAIFVALDVLAEVESIPDLRLICGMSSLVSIISPNYCAVVDTLIFWNVPLPVRLLSWAAGR
jgi:hypothetical protein